MPTYLLLDPSSINALIIITLLVKILRSLFCEIGGKAIASSELRKKFRFRSEDENELYSPQED
ncbi:MAG: hypothetical protein V7L31_10950 [Nostoc sp.]|uniref:hypothetical protein n=1 Tax=Nostoc sp. TaxID=1180 RepID=UPI002FF276A6